MPTALRPHPIAATEVADAELLDRLRSGERAAYGVLWERHEPAARRYARRLAPGRADDVVAEAFAATLSAIDRGLGPRDELRPYLFTAVRRHAARIRPHHDSLDSHPEPATEPDLGRRVETDASPVLGAFAELPRRWQQVLFLADVEGHAVHEVAEMIDLSPNATSALLYRARAGLRQAYLNADGPDPRPRPR